MTEPAVSGPAVLELMRTMGAVRDFADRPVPDDVLHDILDHARFAPSGGNQQPWHVIIVDDPAVRLAIRQLVQLGWREYAAHVQAGVRPFAPGADGVWHPADIDLERARATPTPWPFVDTLEHVPRLLVVTAHLPALAVLDVDQGHQSIVGGASIYPFIQNLLLAARAFGVGGLLTTFLCRQHHAASDLLGLPQSEAIAAAVALGYPQTPVTRLRRRPVQDFTFTNHWNAPASFSAARNQI
ncbi:MAG: nitroreductase family protein [Acidimicrobiales bacterium]